MEFALGICIVAFLSLVALAFYYEHPKAEIPQGVDQPIKLYIVHYIVNLVFGLGRIFEKLGICKEVYLIRTFLYGILPWKNTKLFIKDLEFANVSVRVYQPKMPSAGLRTGVLYLHGGIGQIGSISKKFKETKTYDKYEALSSSFYYDIWYFAAKSFLLWKFVLILGFLFSDHTQIFPLIGDTGHRKIGGLVNLMNSFCQKGMYERVCRFIARESDSVVVCVGYRLAPEHPYPTQFWDCLATARHFMMTAEDYGVDSARIIICGDSSGGTLTAAVCQALVSRTDLPKPRAQIMLYPFLQALDFNLPSYQQNGSVPLLLRNRAVALGLQYLNKDLSLMKGILEGSHVPKDLKLKFGKWLSPDNIPVEFKTRGYKPHVPSSYSEELHTMAKQAFETTFSPLLAEDAIVCQLPEAFILTCEYDVVRDDGLLYKKRLEDNGVPVTWYHAENGFHGMLFLIDYGVVSFPCGKRAMGSVVNFIKGL
nr:arylacetamide deacetylase-like 4 [Pelodiscus sinensis]|eukprot:XP_025042916.1 arylacetamide deacetylase-like 4 [Pelodiscus sinensis]